MSSAPELGIPVAQCQGPRQYRPKPLAPLWQVIRKASYVLLPTLRGPGRLEKNLAAPSSSPSFLHAANTYLHVVNTPSQPIIHDSSDKSDCVAVGNSSIGIFLVCWGSSFLHIQTCQSSPKRLRRWLVGGRRGLRAEAEAEVVIPNSGLCCWDIPPRQFIYEGAPK